MTACCRAAACRHSSACSFWPATLFTALGILDAIRGRILVRIGGALDETLSGRVYDTLMRLPLRVGARSDGTQPLRDLDAVRSYLSGLGPVALVRSAVDPAVSRDLLRLSSAHWTRSVGRSDHSHCADLAHRNPHARAHQGGDRSCCRTQWPRGSQPAQCRGADRHGNGRPYRRALERGQPAIYAQPAGGERSRWRPWARFPKCCA